MPKLDLDLLYQAYGVTPDADTRTLVRTATSESLRHLPFVLSVAVAGGHPGGSGTADAIRRADARIADYADAESRLGEITGVTVFKGPRLAELYPAGVRRPTGDLDVVCADEASLWRAARAIRDSRPVTGIDFSLYGDDREHLLIILSWDSEDLLLDSPLSVELSTAAFPGLHGRIPPRAALPEPTWVASLLSVAEERFQRPFGTKDALDVAMIGESLDPDDDLAAAGTAAVRWRLAPELMELITHARTRCGITRFDRLTHRLRAAAGDESARRDTGTAGPDPTRYGLFLTAADRPGWDAHELHEADGLLIARTPLADYLMVDGPDVGEDTYTRSLRVAAEL